MSEIQETNETYSQNVKQPYKTVSVLVGVIFCIMALLFTLTNLGYYKACVSDLSIDVNSARIRTQTYFLWVKLSTKVNDSGISLALKAAPTSPLGQPDWRLMHFSSWPVEIHGLPRYGRARVSLSQAEQLLRAETVSSKDRERIALAFLKYLSQADFKGLDQLIQAELDRPASLE